MSFFAKVKSRRLSIVMSSPSRMVGCILFPPARNRTPKPSRSNSTQASLNKSEEFISVLSNCPVDEIDDIRGWSKCQFRAIHRGHNITHKFEREIQAFAAVKRRKAAREQSPYRVRV